MRTNAAWIATASLLAVSCGSEIDCRHKGMECAEGFACAQEGGGWQCAPKKAPAGVAAQADPGQMIAAAQNVPPPPPASAPAPARDPNPAGVLCMDHPMCAVQAAKCFCGPNGNLLTRFLDGDGDGKPDEKAIYESDAEGRIVQVVVDEGMDGSADSQHSYKYNDRGDPLAWRIDRLTAASGEKGKDQVVVYLYDSQGKLTRENVDVGIDGSVDSTCRYAPPCPPPIPNASCKAVCD